MRILETKMYEPKPVTAGKNYAGYPFMYGNAFEVSYTPIRTGMFNIYLYGPIESAEQFIPAIEVLQAATESDVVRLHLSTPGGSIDAVDTFLDNMRQCDARIVVHASGSVCSAGTIILLHADEFTLSENASFMIHNGSTGSVGKYSDWKSEVKYTEKFMEKVLRNTYRGFLSETELDDLIKGIDFWLDGDQFAERWEKRQEYLKGEIEESQGELMDMFNKLMGEKEPQEPAPKPTKKLKKKKEPKGVDEVPNPFNEPEPVVE